MKKSIVYLNFGVLRSLVTVFFSFVPSRISPRRAPRSPEPPEAEGSDGGGGGGGGGRRRRWRGRH